MDAKQKYFYEPAWTYEVRGLEVGDLEGCTYLDLPKVYTQSKIPV